MSELTDLYRNLLGQLEHASPGEEIIEIDRQLSAIEDANPELLKGAAEYMIYLPKDRQKEFAVCVIGARGHFIGHVVERLYPHAQVHGILDPRTYTVDYDALMDYVIIHESVVARPDFTNIFPGVWGRALHGESLVLFRSSAAQAEESAAAPAAYRASTPPVTGSDEMSDTAAPAANSAAHWDLFNAHRLECRLDSNGLTILRRISAEHSLSPVKSRYKKVFVVCPMGIKSGGAELLHQLVYWLNYYMGNAQIAYINVGERPEVTCHPELFHYVAGHITTFDRIEDSPENAVVIPEGWSRVSTMVHESRQLFWWMSVDNFIRSFSDAEDPAAEVEQMLEILGRNVDVHMIQSEYAGDYIRRNGIAEERIHHLADYVNQRYLEDADEALATPKENIVLYNPNKGFDFVERLMNVAPELRWIPIEKMTTDQVRNLMAHSKVYIDFGNHPGKDRIPREAAMSGCVVITGRRGSAGFHADVPIPDRYKLDQDKVMPVEVVDVIRDGLENYEDRVRDFADYRDHIAGEKGEFKEDLIDIFGA
ncbi:MAG: hypothetical protein K5840_03095 [Eubacterium sp.]|nr:hypothetical protein [Eubacterium sp.]